MVFGTWEKKEPEATVSEVSESSDEFPACTLPSFTDTFNLIVPIVEFNADGVPTPNTSNNYPQLSALLKKGASPSQVLNDHRGNSPLSKPAFRWIHVPVNKMDWAQRVVENVLGEEMKDGKVRRQPKLAEWMFDSPRWKDQRRGIESFHPLYAQYLQPNLWRYQEKNYALFMPYLHFDTAKSNSLRSATIKWVANGRDPFKKISVPPSDPEDPYDQPDPNHPEDLDNPEYINSKLIERYLDHGAYCKNSGSLHVRRSLDQYYYDTQKNTDDRDVDQIVYKYTKTHRRDLNKVPVVMMVDQLWLWVLEDANVPTVVTCFPSLFKKDFKFRNSDLFQRIMDDLSNESMPDRQIAKSAANLALTIVKKASGLLVSKTLPYHQQFLWMFDNAIAEFAWKQTELWEKFRNNFSLDPRVRKKNNKNKKAESKENEEKLSISEEIELVRDIRDVLDELNIISSVIFDQKPVIAEFGKHVLSFDCKAKKRTPLSYVERVERLLSKMQRDATREFEELKNLLDLKQQQTSIALAEETGRQGSTILLFTFITGFFLPPSFLTSVFGMNIPELAQMRGGIIAAIIAPTSIVLIALSLIAGLYITYSDKWVTTSNGGEKINSRNLSALDEINGRRRYSLLNRERTKSSSQYDV